MTKLSLNLRGFELKNAGSENGQVYKLDEVTKRTWDWDTVVRCSHLVNCWYNIGCCHNVYVKDGVVLREEQVGEYPPAKDSNVPDLNPKGCQKGVCYSDRIYDSSRLKYPLKRAGARGEGKWQRVRWDEALTEIADTMIDVLVADGNEVVLSFRGTQGADTNFFSALALEIGLGLPMVNIVVDEGDEHPGAALTWGKIVVADSADNWFYADKIFIWGGNPAYTFIPLFHFISEARYNGSQVITITPDFNPSAHFSDLWVPIRTGTDAALALSMASVIIDKGMHKVDFIREQTDLPLLVRADTQKFLTQKDMQRNGKDTVFYMFDEAKQKVTEAPWKSLALVGIVPALEGAYEVNTLRGKVTVKPAFQVLKEHLRDYTPEKASAVTGISPELIEKLAVEFATARGVVNVSTANWGKHYHGDLIQRSQILLWALCGHFGRKGASYNAFPLFFIDSSFSNIAASTAQTLQVSRVADPRIATWREQGYTDEMIMHEYQAEIGEKGGAANISLLYHMYGGGLAMTTKNGGWDPYVKRPIQEYLNESLKKGWQVAVPKAKEPKIILERGGSFLKRSRSTRGLVENLLPKLKLLVTVDIRMGSTALYSDFVLPGASSYEKYAVMGAMPHTPYSHLNQRAVDPPGEAKTEWEIYVLLAKKLQERAIAKGIRSFVGRDGRTIRLDNIYDFVTAQGLYGEKDDEAVTRDYCYNAVNLEKMEWEDYKKKGFVAVTGLPAVGPDSACDVVAGEPVIPLTYHFEKKQPYPTLTRRMQFYIDHDWFLELGEALPTHKDIPKMGGDYPLQVTGGHARWSIHSTWKDSPILMRLQRGEPIMFMSAEDARARGIDDGDCVVVFNDIASIEIHAAVSPSVSPGQAIIYHDWENFQFKGKKHFKGLMPSPLNPIELVGGYGHIRPKLFFYHGSPGGNDRGTRVEVRKA